MKSLNVKALALLTIFASASLTAGVKEWFATGKEKVVAGATWVNGNRKAAALAAGKVAAATAVAVVGYKVAKKQIAKRKAAQAAAEEAGE